ncbi:MAG: hypothetical protein SFZ03_10295 [Candidatus Melainabacteria bacterium]|nr:hypothetical protein [Candidatus Melainabacteria bacterium]
MEEAIKNIYKWSKFFYHSIPFLLESAIKFVRGLLLLAVQSAPVTIPLALILTAGYVYCFVWTKDAEIKLANTAPYPVKFALMYPNLEGKDIVSGWIKLNPGESATIKKSFRNQSPFYTRSPEFYVYIEAQDRRIGYVNQYSGDFELERQAEATRYMSQGKWSGCLQDQESFETRADDCNENSYVGGFEIAARAANKELFFFAMQHPRRPMFNVEGDWENDSALSEALLKTQNLAQAIDAQIEFLEKISGKDIPVWIGGELDDFNAPLNPGVTIHSVFPATIWREPNPLQENDIILSIDGHPVFGAQDAYKYLVDHATSYSLGIREPIIYSVLRNGQRINDIKGSYYFNLSYPGYGNDESGLAAIAGLIDGLFFGQSPFLYCMGDAIGAGLQNGWKKALNDSCIRSGYNNCSVNESPDFKPIEHCDWKADQHKALLEQKHSETLHSAEMLAVFMPFSAGRMLFAKSVNRWARTTAGSARLAKPLAGVTNEFIESALWSMGTASPGMSGKQIAQSAFRDAASYAAVGFATSYIMK